MAQEHSEQTSKEKKQTTRRQKKHTQKWLACSAPAFVNEQILSKTTIDRKTNECSTTTTTTTTTTTAPAAVAAVT